MDPHQQSSHDEIPLHFLFSFLRGLELVQIQKTLKEEFGGGTKEFTVREVSHQTLSYYSVFESFEDNAAQE